MFSSIWDKFLAGAALVAAGFAVFWRWRADKNRERAEDAEQRANKAEAKAEQRKQSRRADKKGAERTEERRSEARKNAGDGDRDHFEEDR